MKELLDSKKLLAAILAFVVRHPRLERIVNAFLKWIFANFTNPHTAMQDDAYADVT